MNPLLENRLSINRRHFFGRASAGIGTAALASLFNRDLLAAPDDGTSGKNGTTMLDSRPSINDYMWALYCFSLMTVDEWDDWDDNANWS